MAKLQASKDKASTRSARYLRLSQRLRRPSWTGRAPACYQHLVADLDPTWLLLSLVPSGIGFVLFVYGKKQTRWPQLVAGVALMVYPYFATSVATLVSIGCLIGLGLWYAIRLGW